MSWTRPAGISDSRQKRAKTAPRAKKGAEKRCRKKVPGPISLGPLWYLFAVAPPKPIGPGTIRQSAPAPFGTLLYLAPDLSLYVPFKL